MQTRSMACSESGSTPTRRGDTVCASTGSPPGRTARKDCLCSPYESRSVGELAGARPGRRAPAIRGLPPMETADAAQGARWPLFLVSLSHAISAAPHGWWELGEWGGGAACLWSCNAESDSTFQHCGRIHPFQHRINEVCNRVECERDGVRRNVSEGHQSMYRRG